MQKTLNIISTIIILIGAVLLGATFGLEPTQGLILPLLISGIEVLVVGIIIAIVSSFCVKYKKDRSTLKVEYIGTREEVTAKIENFLKQNGFELVQYNDEKVYQNGKGFWVSRKYIKYEITDTELNLEYWIGLGVGTKPGEEMPIDNKFFGSAAKNQVKGYVDTLVSLVQNKLTK